MSMNLPFYETAQTTRTTPREEYLAQKQAEINANWSNSTQNSFEVLMQEAIGSNIYHQVDVSIDMAIDIGTGYKKGDDFKIFSHKNIFTDHETGLMYQYGDNYWIAVNTGRLASPISSVEVRRCNNILKWVDATTGVVHELPCAVDYELSSPSPQRDKDIIVANGHCLVICQGNDLTWALEKNQRFVMNGQPFKLSAINNLHHDDLNIDSPTLLYLDMYLDTEESDDDLINDVANAFEYNYAVSINGAVAEQVNDSEIQMVAQAYLNGDSIDKDIEWSVNGKSTISDSGVLVLNGEVGDVVVVKATLSGNKDIFDTHSITIVDSIDDAYEIIINPSFTEIRQKQTIDFTATLYKNGVAQSDLVSLDLTGQSIDRVELVILSENNHYRLYCSQPSKYPITMTFTSGATQKIVPLTLKAYF